jgi:hypothetical protein
VKWPGEEGYVRTSDNYQPMTPKQFLRKFRDKEWFDGWKGGKEQFRKITKEKWFYPNEDCKSFDDLIQRVYDVDTANGWQTDMEDLRQGLELMGMLQTPPSPNAYQDIKIFLWPKQIIQLYGREYFNDNFDRLGQLSESYYPDTYSSMPDIITLYHGTDGYAMNDILETGQINASMGRRHGETSGVNWFSTKPTDNFNQGILFSIDVPKEDFENGTFRFMNNAEVTSNDRSIDISKYNLKLVKVGGMQGNYFQRLYEKYNGDIFDMLNHLEETNYAFQDNGLTVDSPLFIKVITQFIGPEPLEEYGVI